MHADFISNNKAVDLQKLSKGVYFFRLFDDKNQTFFSDKILLE
jgi:hypothetical protein